MSTIKDTGKQVGIAALIWGSLYGVLGDNAVVWAQDMVSEIATQEVSERMDKLETEQRDLVVEQRSLREAIEASDKARNEQMQQLILLLRERSQ